MILPSAYYFSSLEQAPVESVDFDSADLAEFDNAADEPAATNNMFASVANDACFNSRGRELHCDVGFNSCTNAQRQDCCLWVGSERNGSCRYRNGGGGGSGGGGGGSDRSCTSNFANSNRNNCENRTRGRSCTWVRRGNGNSFCRFSNSGGGGKGSDHPQCLDIYREGYNIYESSECGLMKALLEDTPLQDIIFNSSPGQVQDVCEAKPTCREQIDNVLSQAHHEGCNTDVITYRGSDISLTKYYQFSGDISILQNYLCTDNFKCFQESNYFYSSRYEWVSCECLVGAHKMNERLSSAAKFFIGMSQEVEDSINSAIDSKGCKTSLQVSF